MIDLEPTTDYVILGNNADVLPALEEDTFRLIYIDPPFNTGDIQERKTLRTVSDKDGDRVGFQGKRYRSAELGRIGYSDVFDDYEAFIAPRLEQARRLLTEDGTLYSISTIEKHTTAKYCST